jgi:predicted DCC family thiol-disulfide oxidoreductase YuxK
MEKESILFYDGDCAMCNHTVQFVVNHEKKGNNLLFAPLQSDFAKEKLLPYKYDFNNLSTMVLLMDGKAYYRSGAALTLAKFLKAPYRWMIVFIAVPRFIRDGVYHFIARNRHKWFRKEYCFLPDADLRKRFVG